ncbi:MAG: glycerol-3-phosphate 1-O-acyltransferase PlsY [Eubacterium sp.]|nr:glycerol-3-phosphate 1-O-acyltransferase PlsY [Eubacterium sp.]
MNILIRVLCLLAGYCFGLIETGVLYGKLKGVDIRKYGSGNLGMTNALRVLGPKAGLVVFIGDLLKAFIPSLIANIVFRNIYPDTYMLYVLYTGFGAVLGHNFPFYLGFKGGKGISSSAGAIIGLLNPWMCLILLTIFIVTVLITKYVSVGSIVLLLSFAITYVIFALNDLLCFNREIPDSKAAMIESIILACIMALLAIIRHKANIGRLIRHEENKLSFHKSK